MIPQLNKTTPTASERASVESEALLNAMREALEVISPEELRMYATLTDEVAELLTLVGMDGGNGLIGRSLRHMADLSEIALAMLETTQ